MTLSCHHVTSKPLSTGRSIIRVESNAVLGFYETQNGGFIPTFVNNLSVFSPGDKLKCNLEITHLLLAPQPHQPGNHVVVPICQNHGHKRSCGLKTIVLKSVLTKGRYLEHLHKYRVYSVHIGYSGRNCNDN
jgi:hypothetical protein